MTRVNITVPDDLLDRAKASGLNVSRVATAALFEELDRRAKVAALDSCLQDLNPELGPISQQEREEAEQWADLALGSSERSRSAGSRTA